MVLAGHPQAGAPATLAGVDLNLVILGDGAAGIAAAEVARRARPRARITIVSDDPHAAYFRAALTNFLTHDTLRGEQLHTPARQAA